MAEVSVMRNNALPYPVYGVAFTVVYPMLDADGDLVTGATTPDAEVSLNGNTFADCTNESTEIATASGVYYLTLTAAEMTADIVAVIAKSATAGMKTTVITLYPRKLPILSTGTCQGSNDTADIQLASGDSAVDDYYNGCLCVAVIDGTTEARIINDYVGSTKVGEVSPAWNTAQPDSNDTYTIYLPEGRQVQPVNVTHVAGTVQTAGDLATLINTVDDFLDTEIAAIKAKTDQLTFTTANQVDASALDVTSSTRAEPGQGTPAATLSLAAKIDFLFKSWRNRKTQNKTTGQWSLYADDATTVDQKATAADDGTTASKSEIETGP